MEVTHELPIVHKMAIKNVKKINKLHLYENEAKFFFLIEIVNEIHHSVYIINVYIIIKSFGKKSCNFKPEPCNLI